MVTQEQKDREWANQLQRIEDTVKIHRTGDGAMCHLKFIDEIQDAAAIMEELLKPEPDETLWRTGRDRGAQ